MRPPALLPRATWKDQRDLVWQGLAKQVSVEVSWASQDRRLTHTAPGAGLELLRKQVYLGTQTKSRGQHGGRVTQLVLLWRVIG